MKKIILLLISIILIGCKKELSENNIDGNWAMSEYIIETDNILSNSTYELNIKEGGRLVLIINDTNVFEDCSWRKTNKKIDFVFFENSFYDKQIFDLEITKGTEAEIKLEGHSKRYDNKKNKTKISLIKK